MRLVVIFLFVVNLLFSQDSIVKIKSSWYGRTMPISLYTGAGLIKDKISQNIEFGRSFGVIDVGLVYGRLNQEADTNKYAEARVTMDASQYGVFSNEISIGIGRVFNPRTPIMLEISYSILAQVYKKWGIGIVTGYYDISGDYNTMNKTFYGVFIRYGLLRTENGGLLNKKVNRHHRRR